MRLYRINTTAYEEGDFFLLTDLTKDKINEVIQPIVDREREGDCEYYNADFHHELIKRYPDNKIYFQVEPEKLVY